MNVKSEFGEAKDIIKLASSVKSPLVSISELVKNGADAGATEVKVTIDSKLLEITIQDDGQGFEDLDVKYLQRLYHSNKKSKGNLTNKFNEYYAGSKGLGLFSAFF